MPLKLIAIVEDDDDLRDLMLFAMLSAGFEVLAPLNTGTWNAEKLSKSVDLFIIDIDLGEVSGIDLCKQIKLEKLKDNGQSRAVVIIASANPNLSTLETDACADDILPKPFGAKELIKKVSGHLLPIN